MQSVLNAQPQLPAAVAKLASEGDAFAKAQRLPEDWAAKRPEEINPAQFIELTRLVYGDELEEGGGVGSGYELGGKVWRKLKHGT